MSQKYGYLNKYVGDNDLKGIYFIPIENEEIMHAEKKIGVNLPSELKLFYKTIGYGIIACGEHYPEMYIDTGGNQILPPIAAATFYKPLGGDIPLKEKGASISTDDKEYHILGWTYEGLQPGDMPFFEVCDGSQYLVMRPHSKNPNAVWSDSGVKIEDSFEKFIWRLYYEGPSYYDDVIAEFYADK